MSPQDYEYLLMALDLARMDKRWGFSIMVLKWKVFLEGYLFSTINCDCHGDGTFEVDRKKMDIDAFIQGESSNKRKDIAFIRIGVLHANSPRKIEMQKGSDDLMIVTPPRLNGLRIKQQSFRQCVEQSKWNYLLEKEDEDGEDDEDDSEDDEDDSDVDSEENATSSPTTSNKKRKYNAVQGIITPGEDENMKANSNTAKSYPYLSRAVRRRRASRCRHRHRR
jgi:Mg-chelatase subunit ChlI